MATNAEQTTYFEKFFVMADATGTGYQTLINGAQREYLNGAQREYLDGKLPKFEETLRRIVRGEIAASAA